MSSLPLDQLRLPSFDKEVDADADAATHAKADINETSSRKEGKDDMDAHAIETIISNDSQHLLSFSDEGKDADADSNNSMQAISESAAASAAPLPVENVDIIGILNSPGAGTSMGAANSNANASVNATGSITPLLPLTPRGGGRKTNNTDVHVLLTPDRGRDKGNGSSNGQTQTRAEMLQQNHQRHISYSSIANDDFPTIEFMKTESSDGSCSAYTPLSPLTPAHAYDANGKLLGMMGSISLSNSISNSSHSNSATNSASANAEKNSASADNLLGIYENLTNKQKSQQRKKRLSGGHLEKNMDIDNHDYTGIHNKGNNGTTSRRGRSHVPSFLEKKKIFKLNMSMDDDSSSSSEGGSVSAGEETALTFPTKNKKNGYGYGYGSRGDEQQRNKNGNGNGYTNGGNGYGNENEKVQKHNANLARKYNRMMLQKPQMGLGGRNTSSASAYSTNTYQKQQKYANFPQPPTTSCKQRRVKKDPHLHAQTLVLAMAFFALWSPQNLMAPNLTQMAEYFKFSADERDLYLGANIAFATGVLSLPVSALLGFMADVVTSRKRLYALTVMLGAISSICTGLSETYTQLYFARFLCGGFMAGAVPIAFSLLGDLFDAKDRNAASSGLTAMMGGGILFGQVFAGMIGDTQGWKQPFYVSGVLSIVTSFMVMVFVREPVRGGKEKVLQEMIAKGTRYERKLTAEGFFHAMTQNKTNVILMIQGFFTSIPWGVIYTFLNDYLSQEKGLSVPAATILVLWFGLGAASGGIAGGYLGMKAMKMNRSMLPILMAVSTFLGIFPFLGLLDFEFHSATFLGAVLGYSGGFIANLPSVNVRPCLINVNPPETRGAAMTAANLIISVARGLGPLLITLSQAMFGMTRQYSFNMVLIVFWSITTVLLLFLAKTFPSDQDAMDAELARYAESMINRVKQADEEDVTKPLRLEDIRAIDDPDMISLYDDLTMVGENSIVSIEDRMTSFDAAAAKESWSFLEGALREIAVLSHISSPKYEAVSDDECDSHEIILNDSNKDSIEDEGINQQEPDQTGIGFESNF